MGRLVLIGALTVGVLGYGARTAWRAVTGGDKSEPPAAATVKVDAGAVEAGKYDTANRIFNAEHGVTIVNTAPDQYCPQKGGVLGRPLPQDMRKVVVSGGPGTTVGIVGAPYPNQRQLFVEAKEGQIVNYNAPKGTFACVGISGHCNFNVYTGKDHTFGYTAKVNRYGDVQIGPGADGTDLPRFERVTAIVSRTKDNSPDVSLNGVPIISSSLGFDEITLNKRLRDLTQAPAPAVVPPAVKVDPPVKPPAGALLPPAHPPGLKLPPDPMAGAKPPAVVAPPDKGLDAEREKIMKAQTKLVAGLEALKAARVGEMQRGTSILQARANIAHARYSLYPTIWNAQAAWMADNRVRYSQTVTGIVANNFNVEIDKAKGPLSAEQIRVTQNSVDEALKEVRDANVDFRKKAAEIADERAAAAEKQAKETGPIISIAGSTANIRIYGENAQVTVSDAGISVIRDDGRADDKAPAKDKTFGTVNFPLTRSRGGTIDLDFDAGNKKTALTIKSADPTVNININLPSLIDQVKAGMPIPTIETKGKIRINEGDLTGKDYKIVPKGSGMEIQNADGKPLLKTSGKDVAPKAPLMSVMLFSPEDALGRHTSSYAMNQGKNDGIILG
jgi:hypothetical protein